MTDDLLSLANALSRTMRTHAPEWTDGNDSDPGITILGLMAYLAEGLLSQATPSQELSFAAARAIQALEAIADGEPAAVFVDGERWRRVEMLADAGPDGAVFTLDSSTGEITFGDGVNGRAPNRVPPSPPGIACDVAMPTRTHGSRCAPPGRRHTSTSACR